MFLMKYLLKFYKIISQVRLLILVALIACVVILTSNPDWFDYFISQKTTIFFDNTTVDNLGVPRESLKSEIKISEIYPNCGLKHVCSDNTFPVHIYTGQDKDDQPKLCVQGKYVGGGGRGLNIAVIETKYLQLVSMQTFDLYSHNSSSLESWLTNSLQDDDIIIAFTFDEASKELSKKAKAILYDLGSGKIQDLQFRSQWYMISQKGIGGFTPLENLTHAQNERWGEAIDERLCVPRKIEPMAISPDPFPRKNIVREKLCETTTELMCEDFCNILSRHEVYSPSLLTNRSLIGNPIFSTPIIVISGSLSSLVITLETLIYQPGIHSASVFVIHTESQTKVPQVCQIFGFRNILLNATYNDTTNDKISFGLKFIHEAFPLKKYAIVIEEGLILSPDFLFYHGQFIHILEKDNSIIGVSAWNPYGYKSVSGNYSWAYRVESFPGLGFLIRMDIFCKSMMDNMRNCCFKKTYLGWNTILQEYKDAHIIIPDVSRVLKRPKDLYDNHVSPDEFKTFTNPRITNIKLNAYIERPQDLTEDRYFLVMAGLVQSSITFHLTDEDLKLCENGSNIAIKIMLTELKNKIFSVYYQEDSCTSYEKLRSYLKCFDIFVPKEFSPQNIYKKITRFTINRNIVLLIEATSKFAKKKI
ncbi:protein O-linked-mannose beta-1,2-N-acetylglucosaminyltransferase 1 [Halyomorpha halys]|uniref:protein O-linked-mannose beta-1,2-N-acetylglucosaminyltransferase 1 n=1 Tax=Halyomorpha halys TaxID=286706 RepID=UPI0006D4FAA5|nr:protein O-linked-mannose beta-1,2-N-acetylglucosaminyltransferase 1-like [Halyomorpha halys]